MEIRALGSTFLEVPFAALEVLPVILEVSLNCGSRDLICSHENPSLVPVVPATGPEVSLAALWLLILDGKPQVLAQGTVFSVPGTWHTTECH
jgi:hypothetical protein